MQGQQSRPGGADRAANPLPCHYPRVPDHTMESVVRALDRMERRMGAKFREVFRSITVDNGCEFQDCEGMERSKRARKPRTKIFYCHPYSAYERGTNENMNRIIRRFFPKGTNFDDISTAESNGMKSSR